MATATPRITLKQIQQAATERSFDRGKDYYSDGAIVNAMRQEFRIWANCYGSEVYETSVTLNQSGIHTSSCSCPYDWGGMCKHQVALLLTYLHNPDRVQVIAPLSELLKPKSREDLVKLIQQMLEQSPDLLLLIDTPSKTKTGESLNLSTYKRQIQRAFRSDEMWKMVKALNPTIASAQTLLEAGNWQDAGRLYQMLLGESIDLYNDITLEVDYNGEVLCLIQDMAAGLAECLGQADDADDSLRRFWLETMLNGEFKNLELGGMDFASGSWEGILKFANDDEWIWIETALRSQIKTYHSNHWKQEALVEMLAERLEKLGDDRASENIIEELGSPEQKIFLWMSQGKWDAAIASAKIEFRTSPGLIFKLANELLAVGRSEQALAYILGEIINGGNHWHYDEWLEKYYGEYGSRIQAIEWIIKGFERSPNLNRYLKLKALHPKKREWKTLQKKLFDSLETKMSISVWIDIMLAEDDLDRAIGLLDKFNRYARFSDRTKVAQVAEKQKPEAAIVIYQTIVTNVIDGRTRQVYQQSTEYLKMIRSLYASLNQQSQWKSYLAKLRITYSKLPALQDELTKAKL